MYSFNNEKKEITFDSHRTPTPWMNYFSNGSFHTMMSQAGGGVAFYKSPQIWRINHYRFFHLPTVLIPHVDGREHCEITV
ncbi:MAG: hypothetical protein IJD51_00605 [Clostridia bacterium]|nr:hypothetical protein [Clostridia bacterium]